MNNESTIKQLMDTVHNSSKMEHIVCVDILYEIENEFKKLQSKIDKAIEYI